MVTNLNINFFLLLILLPLTVWAQGNMTANQIPDALKNHQFGISALQLSPDGRFVIFNKSYEQNRDTLAVVDSKDPKNIILQVPNSHSVRFTKSGDLFFCSGDDAELMKLPSKKSKKWKGVTAAHYLRKFNHLAIARNDSLIINDEHGNMIRVIPSIVSSRLTDGEIFYMSKDKNLYRLWCLEKDGSLLLHSSTQPLLIGKRISRNAFIIYEKHHSGFKIFYRNASGHTTKEFRYDDAKGIKSAAMTPVEMDDKNIFLTLNFFSEPRDKSQVELWYGNDKKIDQRFFDDAENKVLIWNHVTGKVTEVQDKEHSHLVYVGNPTYLLSFDPYQYKDYINEAFPIAIFKYDIALKKHEFLVEAGGAIYTDPKGKFLVTPKNGQWMMLDISSGEKKMLPVNSSRRVYFSQDAEKLLFENEGSLDIYDMASGKHQIVKLPPGFRSKLINGDQLPISPGFPIYKASFTNEKDVLLHLWKKEDNMNSIASFNGKILKTIIPPTQDYISEMFDYSSRSQFLFVCSNINKPPSIWLQGKVEKMLYNSVGQDIKALKIRSEWITSRNEKGVELKGVLMYPLHFDKNRKYPMVVSIYESQRSESNQYLVDGMFGSTEGINSRYLIENGYFVFLPEIVYDDRGAGRSALDCVESSFKVLKNNISIDFSKVGLVGHSYGGYESNFIATQSKLFATYVAGAGNSDLVRSYHSYNYLWNGPFYWQFEGGQYRMPGSFTNYKSLYIDNSPVYHADKVNDPILLWAGKKDENIDWQQSMEFYLALRRNNKQVIALFYPDDDHSLKKLENRVDLYSRIYQWLDYHLKDKQVEWITRMKN
ncbi:dienelactone hydrolase [Chryseobacterium ginsenosidimutans]|uniref:alpha/beta hydrolase family protein n=1 Tax=Chryseobacterium ginsenosidimutans TaxID=687846 RepID=UPI00216A78C4|nr:prolyl oligopeptidase family serine peptidase [Chryseobacterium ginsenosidimutans]MCS3869469.1 dienelactone hydrolase [Chryseobacterium ginsenosidimutans]